MKLYFSYGTETREGFETKNPEVTMAIEDGSVEEIQGEDVLEKVPNLIAFIDECHRILKPGGRCVFSAPHYASSNAWKSPLAKRALGEQSLNFADKEWRTTSKYTEAAVKADFSVVGQFAVEEEVLNRSDEAKAMWMRRYLNVAQAILFTLTKKE